MTVNAKVFKAVNGSKSGHAVTLLSFDLRYFNLINLKVVLVKNVEENLIQIIIKFLGEVIGINANINFSNFQLYTSEKITLLDNHVMVARFQDFSIY